MALSDNDIARIMTSIPEPASDSGNDVAVWVSNLCIAIEAETRKQDKARIRQLVGALKKAGYIAAIAVKTNSRDIADWRDDMDCIAAIAAQPGEKS